MKKPLLQGCPQSGHNRPPGQQAGGWAPRLCPECMKLFEPNRRNQLFCEAEHNAAWTNRQTVRGRVLTSFAMTAYITRNGTRGTPEAREAGKTAARKKHQLIQQWRDDDRAAGRMEWPEFMRVRIRFGLYDD